MEESIEELEELPNFSIGFEDDLAVILASKSNEPQRDRKQQIALWEL